MGLIHQDVKPLNVMMTADGVAKVTDFGLAGAKAVAFEENEQRPADATILATWGGMTPAYCSPEQAEIAAKKKAGTGREQLPKLTRRTDVWSWATSVLHMFLGKVVWPAGQVAHVGLHREPDEPHLPPLPPAVKDLVRTCLQKRPEDRPHDLMQVADVLQTIYQQVTGERYPREMPHAAEAVAATLNNRAVSMMDLGKPEEALKLWEQALQADHHHPESTYNCGLVRWRSGRIDDAKLLWSLRGVTSSHPGEWLPQYLLAQVHRERGDCLSVIKVLETVERADAGREGITLLLAWARETLPQSRRLLHTMKGSVASVSLSGDGRYALSGGASLPSTDTSVKLWDVNSGTLRRTFEGHTDKVTSVSLSGDGRFALSGSQDKTIKLWDVASGNCMRTFEGHTGGVTSVSWSEDGRYALSGSQDKTIKLWDVASGTCLHTIEGPRGCAHAVSLSGDGRHALSTSGDKTIKLWDIASGTCKRTFKGHTGKVTSVSLSRDGRYALSGSNDKTIKLWDIASGDCLRTLEGHTGGVISVSLSRDGRYALSGAQVSHDRTIKLWDITSGKCLRTFEGGDGGDTTSVSLSGDGRYGLAACGDTVKLWATGWADDIRAPLVLSQLSTVQTILDADAAYKRAMQRARQHLEAANMAAAALCVRKARLQPGYERKSEALGLWAELYLRLARTMKEGWEERTFEGHTNPVTSVSLSRDGRYALSGSGGARRVILWDVAAGTCLRTFDGHTSLASSLCWSADGCYALSGSQDKTIKLWDVSSGKCKRTFKGHTDKVTSVSLSGDGRYALSGSNDKTIKLWDIHSGRCLRTFEGHTGWVTSVSLSRDGRYALSGGDSSIKLWDIATGTCLRTFEEDTPGVASVSWSEDGRYALSGGNSIKLWDIASGKCLRTLAEFTYGITAVSWSGDGRYALSGRSDGTINSGRTIKLWDITSGKCLRTFEGHTRMVTAVSWSGDGRYALSGSHDKTVKLWFLDWELVDRQPADWDKGARPYLEVFLAMHTPYAGTLPQDRAPTEAELTLALSRRGTPTWSDEDFQQLLYTLGCAGYGWLRPEGVRRELEKMTAAWQGPPPLIP